MSLKGDFRMSVFFSITFLFNFLLLDLLLIISYNYNCLKHHGIFGEKYFNYTPRCEAPIGTVAFIMYFL